ncbi:hypothetical protein S40288_11710 [Stachybotrys chartarum IBT 40288]|nr:hypothetical protein S40288_11710 [Stachybotrys chartarum IBT 40288]
MSPTEYAEIENHLIEIDHAIKSIQERSAQIRCLLRAIHGPSSDTANTSNEDSEDDRNSRLSDGKQFCPDPDCSKGPFDEKQLRRHYPIHVNCSDISKHDVQCVCCKIILGKVSTFKKKHNNCLERMRGDLSQDKIREAMAQRDRIDKGLKRLLASRIRQKPSQNPRKRGQDSVSEGYSTKARRIETVDVPPAHDPQMNSASETGPLSIGVNHRLRETELGVREIQAPMVLAPPYPYAQGASDGELYHRSSAMLVNPMDGVLWLDDPFDGAMAQNPYGNAM